jgi:ubiquinone/menaquinone biosynthesis C-methylase UbiE
MAKITLKSETSGECRMKLMAHDQLRRMLVRSRHIVQWLRQQGWLAHGSATDFHFVRDYRRVVTKLLARYPLDKAMALAVGGDFEHMGLVECALLRYAGLRDNMSLIDFGCGSGRLAWALGKEPIRIDYYGVDVEQRLLDYAKTKSPPHFRFALNHTLHIRAPDAAADMVCAFSVFTHLHHAETYLYLEDIHRVLRRDGRLVFSFLEFAQPLHWKVFEETVAGERRHVTRHLNQFIERNAIELWCESLGYERVDYISGDAAPWGDPGPLGQSAVILRRR